MKENHVISEKADSCGCMPNIGHTNRITSKFYVLYPTALNNQISHLFTSNPKFGNATDPKLLCLCDFVKIG